ncbi:uroporphyrinogen-III C-methyltransferase [Leptospira sp. 96542]|nr:uroporphyrinogen-III C-methyltransferase [Leptospira sp. 96542]
MIGDNIPKNKVYLVGAGPGDPDLLTIKALKILRQADVVFYDDLVSSRILGLCRKKTNLVYVGKRSGIHSCLQDEINEKLIEAAQRNKVVVRLKGGDPSIFGRVGEEYSALLTSEIECEMIAGITTASGLAASLGLPLTHRNYSCEIVFLSGHKKNGINNEDFKNLNCVGKTVIVYMGLNSLNHIINDLLNAGNARKTKIAVIQNVTLPSEKIYVGELDSIESIVLKNQVKSPAILVIGEILQFYSEMENLKKNYSKILQPL